MTKVGKDDIISKYDLYRKFTTAPSGERFRLKDVDGFPTQVKLSDVQREIRQAKPIKGLEVVIHCKDCKHWQSRIDENGGVKIACYMMQPDDFCSHAEPRGGLKI